MLGNRLLSAPRTAAPLGLLLVAAVGSGWLMLDVDSQHALRPNSSVTGPDIVVEGLLSTTLGADGLPKRKVRASKMVHLPDSDTHELTDPFMEVLRPDQSPWFVSSERGLLSPDGDEMMLIGNVHIWRNAADGARQLDIRTSDMRVLPNEEYGETDQPVTITTPHSQSTSVGARAYLKTGRLEMLSQVRTVYARN